ncbi:MAG: sulfatase-like hydrolase/transferase [Planctomycetota bacterium]|nr:sulfatase-like hydrolase/transferase [Planctomycetota bacterium]
MKRREFLRAAGLGLTAFSLEHLANPACLFAAPGDTAATAPATGPASSSGGAGERPNIIFILADDLGLGDVGCYGSDRYKTPRIDALAKEGVRFTRCYSTPLCGPSRCQLLTGRYPFRTGLINNTSAEAIRPDREVMIPTVMKKAGYVTGHAGKWGQMSLGPAQWGFDEHLVYNGSGVYTRAQAKEYRLNNKRHEVKEGEYVPDLMHNFTVRFVEKHKDQPFFLYYSMSHIHSPIVPTPDSKPGDGEDAYAENIAYMDKLVGKLVDELDRLKLRERTLILFAGDNGTWGPREKTSTIGSKRLNGAKGSMWEGGSRVPLVANWPGTTPAGQVRDDLVDFSDALPTFAALGGAPLPAGVTIDGQSFAEPLRGRKGSPREWVYVELNGRSYVREERWKLTNGGELYDMRDSPFEERLVDKGDASGPDAAAARGRLQKVLDEHPAAKGSPADDTRRGVDVMTGATTRPGKRAGRGGK